MLEGLGAMLGSFLHLDFGSILGRLLHGFGSQAWGSNDDHPGWSIFGIIFHIQFFDDNDDLDDDDDDDDGDDDEMTMVKMMMMTMMTMEMTMKMMMMCAGQGSGPCRARSFLWRRLAAHAWAIAWPRTIIIIIIMISSSSSSSSSTSSSS
eukprot:8856095-Karenia_brevis.AAC.1